MGRRHRPWRSILRRRLARPVGEGPGGHPLLITLAVGVLLAWGTIQVLEWKLRPAVAQMARTQVQNTVVAAIELAVTEDLARRDVSYGDLVTIERDQSGAITALTTDMAQLNLLRAELTAAILERDVVPFYCASVTNIGSQGVAFRAGLAPAWVSTYRTVLDGSFAYGGLAPALPE